MRLKDVRVFLTVAKDAGYRFEGRYCIKELYYDMDYMVEIKIDLISGNVDISAVTILSGVDITKELTYEDCRYLLRNIDYLVDFEVTNKLLKLDKEEYSTAFC